MAGESPDKSDKKQSSGETARSERDPRLSVLRREPAEPAEEAATGEGEDSNPSEPSEPSEASGAGETGEASELNGDAEAPEASDGAQKDAGDEEDSEAGDERLRTAVAAWVAGKGDEDAEGGTEAGAEGGAEGRAETGGGGPKDDEARAETGDASAKPEVDADAVAEVEAEPGADESEGGEPEGGDKSEPKSSADEAKSEAKPESEAKAKSRSTSKPKSEAKSEAEVVDQPTAVFKTVGPQKSKPVEAADEEDGADGSAVDDATRVFAVAKAKGKSASTDASAPVDQATTTLKINPPAKAPTKAPTKSTTTAAAKDSDSKKDSEKDSAKGSGKDSGKDSAKGSGRDSEKDSEKDSGKSEDGKGAKKDTKAPAAESDAERTSQFVALKSADDGTAGKSLGKTAPRTPLGTPGKPAGKAGEKTTGKPTDKTTDKPADKAGTKEKASGAQPAAASAAPSKPAGPPGALPPAAPTGAGAPARPDALPESERTKQQPLPPLDLLAKLTNTPPPPETPLRIVVRRFKIWTPLVVLLAIIFVIVQGVRPLPNPTLTVGDASSSFTFEGGKLTIPWPAQGQAAIKVVGSGDLGTFGPQKPVPTASVAKIMTAYVILRDHPLKKDEGGPQIEVDAKAVTEGGSRHESRIEGLKAGQKFSQQNMLKMLMIPSGNNIARLLARWDSKSDNEAAFVKKMNAAAKDLGMKNTTYTDPSGLDPKTVSTAVDQLKLAEAVMKFDAFRPIVAMTNADIPGLSQRINSNIDNLLLAGLSIKGIKTGSSTAAGGTLSWAAYKTVDGKDRLILGTMMDQHFKGLDPDGANSLTLVKQNSQKVIEAVRNALTSAPAVKKGQVVGYVDDGLNGLTPVVATKDLKAVGVPGQKLKLSVGDGGKTVPHTAKAGTVVGVLTVGNGESMQKVPVALKEDLVEPSFGAKLVRIT
ncbi:D-alanyl-D-alanine carboxypeptidase [Streptomyces sp. N2A]|uniref:D-alanyl-D-alanine carboxypeptidase n=1 Tax=Streptomyces sp. N2A TaxID=3073936 RepID=UPI00286FD7BF|nr:D-alanyl-D-alanine carboxypeptidase [Streptomyces sp. N2A]